MLAIFFVLAAGGCLWAEQSAQAPNPSVPLSSVSPAAPMAPGTVPIYRVTVVARTMKAINYNHRGGMTRIGFQGTELQPQATGSARVESKQGVIKIDAEMEKLEPAGKFGPEYLTYVLWAITPEGRATNVGEVLLKNGKSKLNATTELQSFGLMVTAEPYFAVTQPSDVVVMENFVRPETTGTIEQVNARFELLQRGQYTLNVNPTELHAVVNDRKTPLELYEARNAVQIARWTGAERYAPETYQKAVIGLQNAEGYLRGKSGSKPIGTVAREAVQMAEDSRIITVKKMGEEQLEQERTSAAERQLQTEKARAAAQSETDRVSANAESARIASQVETERVARDTEARTTAAALDAERRQRASDARVAFAQAESERLQRQNEASSAAAQVEANRLRQANDAERALTEGKLDQAAAEMAQAQAEKIRLRGQLLEQFNAILQTRDSARGLIVNISDVLFDTAKFSLRPQAREKLARVAGILAGHPGLQLQVEGFTDSVGTEVYNQQLSENRAASVRQYLTESGLPATSVTAKGFGKLQPVATNDTSAGRQLNRRVELVVSGEIIGGDVQTAPAASPRPLPNNQ